MASSHAAIEFDWKFWQARINLGALLRDGGTAEQCHAALHHHLMAYAVAPGEAATQYNLAETHVALGHRAATRWLLERCCAAYPDFPLARRSLKRHAVEPAWPSPTIDPEHKLRCDSAVALMNAGRVTDALAAFEQLPAATRNDAFTLTNHGNALGAVGRFDEALALHQQAIDSEPRSSIAHHNAGFAHHKLQQLDPAIAAYRLALTFEPREIATWINLANALREQGHALLALDAFRVAHDLQPTARDPLAGIAAVARSLDRWDMALNAYRQMEKSSPRDAFVANELGACYFGLGRYDEARACFNKATEFEPKSPWGFANLAGLALHLGDYTAIKGHLREALTRQPDNLAMLVSLGHAQQQTCDWSDFESLCDRIEALIKQGLPEGNPLAVLPLPLFSLPLESLSLGDHLVCARRYGEDTFGKLRLLRRPDPQRPSQAGERIRIGYLSCDFHEHPVSQVLAETIELHDRQHFEVFAFAHGKSPEDGTRHRLRQAFDHFVDIDAMTDEAAVDAIRSRQIDVLIDLGGYTRSARGGVMVLRAAPTQINYLGYPGTLGTDFADVIIADGIVIPPELELGYAEKILRLPHCYLPSDRKRPLGESPSRASLGLPQTGVVFCAFNSPHKITPDMFAIWCRLLLEIPGSALWLRADNPTIKSNLVAAAARHGVAAERLVFAPRADLPTHYARMQTCDLLLDTFPYTSHSTASDALWCGVPIVTRIGETFASRVAASMLTACGMPELVATTAVDYHRKALELARDRPRLKALKQHLEDRRLSLPAFDSVAHTRALEDLYRQAMRRHAAPSETP